MVLFIFEQFGGIMLGVNLKPNLIKRFLVIQLYRGFFKFAGNKFNRVYAESKFISVTNSTEYMQKAHL